MARRHSDVSPVNTKIGKDRSRDKASADRADKRTELTEIGPDGSAAPSTKEFDNPVDVVDIRHVHDVNTGQSRVVVLPADLCRRLGISEGTPLQLVERDSHFEVIPMRRVLATEKTSYALHSLLEGVNPENIHGEIDIGPAVGRESW